MLHCLGTKKPKKGALKIKKAPTTKDITSTSLQHLKSLAISTPLLDNNDDQSDRDYSEDEEEGDDEYRPGGYHPVQIGDKFNKQYTVINKLGWGHFSTVWLCYDKKAIITQSSASVSAAVSAAIAPADVTSTHPYIALKIQKSALQYTEAALDEISLFDCIQKNLSSEYVLKEHGQNYDPCIVTLINHFEHIGVNGRHRCMVFELMGENLLSIIKMYNYRLD